MVVDKRKIMYGAWLHDTKLIKYYKTKAQTLLENIEEKYGRKN